MEDQAAVDAYAGRDTEAAMRAFDCLCERSRGFLHAFLQRRFAAGTLKAEDRNDIVQITFLKVWDNRSKFQNRGIAAWFAFLRKTAYHTALDSLPAQQREMCVVDPEEYNREPPNYNLENEIITKLADAIETGRLFDCADVVWLGMDRMLTPAARNRQIRAAYHFYLLGASYEQVLRLFPPLSPEDLPLTRETLDEWLSDPGVLRALAYREIYYSNDRLACHLLTIHNGCQPARLNELMRQVLEESRTAENPTDGEAMEIAIILWRYRYGLLAEQILLHADCAYNREQLDELFIRSAERFPFSDIMAKLCLKIRKARAVFGTRSLWQRLAFQYRYLEELPHRDIQERTQPAAKHVDYDVTLATLNGWLSNGSLLQQLAKSYTAVHGDGPHG